MHGMGTSSSPFPRTISRIGLSTFFANATTSIGFLVFYFTRSEVLMEFGLIAGLNVILTYMISLILIRSCSTPASAIEQTDQAFWTAR
jgi:predicted RND superfamily exporter protein